MGAAGPAFSSRRASPALERAGFGHDCFEDCCCCLDPEDDKCGTCDGEGTIPICLSSAEWCEAHPMPGRENTERSTVESFSVQGMRTGGGE